MYNSSLKYLSKKKPNEVQMARGRLKNALHDLVVNSEEESILPNIREREKHRGRPKKIIAESKEVDEGSQNSSRLNEHQIHESFVMKLFDRSLDLSKYDESTPLYPICRAWMNNTPRSTTIKSYRNRRSPFPRLRENDGGEVLEKLRNRELDEMCAMPAPLNTELLRIPSSLVDGEDDESRKNAELRLKGASKVQLLAAHKQRWEKVRKHWQNHTKVYNEEKYELNFQIIDEMYKC